MSRKTCTIIGFLLPFGKQRLPKILNQMSNLLPFKATASGSSDVQTINQCFFLIQQTYLKLRFSSAGSLLEIFLQLAD